MGIQPPGVEDRLGVETVALSLVRSVASSLPGFPPVWESYWRWYWKPHRKGYRGWGWRWAVLELGLRDPPGLDQIEQSQGGCHDSQASSPATDCWSSQPPPLG